MQAEVHGNIEPYRAENFTIHPMFCHERERWSMARQLLSVKKGVRIYVNDNGILHCCPNMATVITNRAYRIGGCPHLLGDVIIVATEKVMTTLGFVERLTGRDPADESDDDDEESDSESKSESESKAE